MRLPPHSRKTQAKLNTHCISKKAAAEAAAQRGFCPQKPSGESGDTEARSARGALLDISLETGFLGY
ncbi:MAG: hypothetical protein COV71_04055 [Candidatus Omnitrophica bacterium CG11_big_fil_rev_8_21_14_0_20_41_12]|nr:MAG: hypothetical protein COV71_04055 [Candidatus Omnitrophica bacterium CG11_big_fil_rev_8_21_14_0_20_41_12]